MASVLMFRAQFPEMANASDVLVNIMLGAAALELDASVWGPYGAVGDIETKADQGQMYLAAHKLATSPWGQAGKMMPNGKATGYNRTVYGEAFKMLMTGVTSGFRVS